MQTPFPQSSYAGDLRVPPFVELGRCTSTAATAAADPQQLMQQFAQQFTQEAAKEQLQVIGQYAPSCVSPNGLVLCLTSPLLQQLPEPAVGVALASVMRVAIAKEKSDIIISCVNPQYICCAYYQSESSKAFEAFGRVTSLLLSCMSTLASLHPSVYVSSPSSSVPVFGSGKKIGKRVSSLIKYQFMVGMPEFKDRLTAAKGDKADKAEKHAACVNNIVNNIQKANDSLTHVFTHSVRDGLTVIGVGMNKVEAYFNTIDGLDSHSHLAFLPYEILVEGSHVSFLHGRYRIALHFPELTMSTFTKIMEAPGQIEDTFKKIAANK